MSRILFVVPPLTGHINPTVAVGAELAARGHDVAWAGHPAALRSLLPGSARVFPVIDDAFDARLADVRGTTGGRRAAPAAMKFFWENFIMPLAHAMLPGVSRCRRALRATRGGGRPAGHRRGGRRAAGGDGVGDIGQHAGRTAAAAGGHAGGRGVGPRPDDRFPAGVRRQRPGRPAFLRPARAGVHDGGPDRGHQRLRRPVCVHRAGPGPAAGPRIVVPVGMAGSRPTAPAGVAGDPQRPGRAAVLPDGDRRAGRPGRGTPGRARRPAR